MHRDGFGDLLRRMADGWNRGVARAVAACFADQLSYSDPLNYSFQRLDDLFPFFEPPEGGTHRVEWHRILFDEVEQTGVAEYTYQGHRRYHGAVIARVEGGKVVHWREWQHRSDLDWDEFVKERPGDQPGST